MYDGSIVISSKIDTKEFDKQIDYIEGRLEEIEYQLKQADLGFEVGDTQKLEQEYEKLSNRLIDLQKQKEKVNETPLENPKTTSAFSNNISKLTTKIARMGLAMLGIRGLFGMVSSSVSRIASVNPELQAQIDGIRSKIDNVVMKLVDLVLPVISIITDLVGKILKGLFGIDISSGNFSKNMTTANKSATKLRKQLMGFDEMNILNKDGSIGGLGTGGTGGGNTDTKDYGIYNDMSDLNKGLADLGYVAVYTGDDLKETRLELEQLIADVKNGQATMTKKNGIITITNKAGKSIKLTTKEYEKLLDDINKSRVTSRNLDIWWKVKDTFQSWDVSSFKKNLGSAIEFAKNGLNGATITYENDMVKVKLATGEVFTFTKEQWEKINEQARLNANNTKNNWVTSLNEIVAKATGNDPNSLKGGLLGVFDLINKESAKDAEETKNKWMNTADEMTKKFIGAFSNLPDSSRNEMQEAINAANNLLNKFVPPKKQVIFEANVTKVKERLISLLTKLATAGGDGIFGTINNRLISAIRNAAKGAIINPPRLASGGIINRPGRGVPLAIGGERGREAVVPLTDSQQMAYLGREIAKNVVINLTNVTEIDGRQLARVTAQVMNDMQFASNGGVI